MCLPISNKDILFCYVFLFFCGWLEAELALTYICHKKQAGTRTILNLLLYLCCFHQQLSPMNNARFEMGRQEHTTSLRRASKQFTYNGFSLGAFALSDSQHWFYVNYKPMQFFYTYTHTCINALWGHMPHIAAIMQTNIIYTGHMHWKQPTQHLPSQPFESSLHKKRANGTVIYESAALDNNHNDLIQD